MRISDWSSDVCSSDLQQRATGGADESAFSHLSPASATGNGRSYRRIAEAQSSAFHLCACLRDVCLGGTKPGDRCVEFLLADRLILQQRPIAINILLSIGCIGLRSEEHTSELQSLMRISYAVFCLKKIKIQRIQINDYAT